MTIAERKHQEQVAQDVELLKEELGRAYSEIAFRSADGPRRCYLANWNSGRRRLIQVDNTTFLSPRAKRHFEHGCDTRNEASVFSKLPEAEKHHIGGICDLRYRGERVISVKPYLGERRLEERLKEGPLTQKEARRVFSEMADAVKYYTSRGFYHRDFSKFNIVLDETGGAWLVDFANATEKGKVKPSFMPTAGAHIVTDPFIFERFTGKEGVYDDRAENYQIAATMLECLLGRSSFDIDADMGTARDFYGKNLLDESGKIDSGRYIRSLKRDLKRLPFWAGWGLDDLILSAMSPYRDKRPETMKDFLKKLDKHTRPGIAEKARRNWKSIGIAAVVTAVLAAAGAQQLLRHQASGLEEKTKQAQKYEVVADCEGYGFEVKNNLVDFEPVLIKHNPYDVIYGESAGHPKFLRMKQGDKFEVHPRLKEKPRPSYGEYTGLAFPGFKGSVYFEGWPAVKFSTDSVAADESAYEDGYPYIPDVTVEVPKDMPDGVNTLWVDIYSQNRGDPPNTTTALSDIRYKEPGKAICRKPITVIVGNPEVKIAPHVFSLRGYTNYLSIERVDSNGSDKIKPSINYSFSIPEMGFSDGETVSEDSFNGPRSPRLPKADEQGERLLRVFARDTKTGELYGNWFFPIRERRIYYKDPKGENKPYFSQWTWDFPDENFPDKLVRCRQEAIGSAASRPTTMPATRPSREFKWSDLPEELRTPPVSLWDLQMGSPEVQRRAEIMMKGYNDKVADYFREHSTIPEAMPTTVPATQPYSAKFEFLQKVQRAGLDYVKNFRYQTKATTQPVRR